MRNCLKMSLAGVALLALAACNNDDGNNSGNGDKPVALSSADDVKRELSNVFGTFELELVGLSISPASGGEPTLRASVATPRPLPRQGTVRSLAQPPRAAAPVSSACGTSGTDTRTTDSKSRSFTWFSFTGTVQYQLDVFAACAAQSSGDSAETTNGTIERGQTDDNNHLYALFGSGATPVDLKQSGSTQSSELRLVGGVEAQAVTNQSDDILGVMQADLITTSDGGGNSAHVDLGRTGEPFETHIVSNGFAFTGIYSYTAGNPGCAGGDVHITTPATLTVSSDELSGASFGGGSLKLASGDKSVTLTFNADGSATMAGDVTGTLSADDVTNALQSQACFALATLF